MVGLMNGVSAQEEDNYNLLTKVIPNLDRHLVFPVLEFLEGQDDQDPMEIKNLKYQLLKETNMTDFVAGLEMEIKDLPERPQEYNTKREEVMQRRQLLEQETEKLTGLLDNEEVASSLRADKAANLSYLKDTHGVSLEEVALLYDYGQFMYSIGDYGMAADLLFQFRLLSTDNDKTSQATWGKLACEILQANWENAMEEIQRVRETIDTRLFNAPLAQLHNRTWLLHWSLFPLFHHEPARDQLIELFFSPSYINTIQTSCPWLLRHLAVAVISSRNKAPTVVPGQRNTTGNSYQKQMKDLTRVVRQESYEYADPVTAFLKALYVDFDFEEAQSKLGIAQRVLADDFFLHLSMAEFVEAARHLISESYCKIHQRIDIK